MGYLNEAETHWCDLPQSGRRGTREFMPKREPIGRRWGCDECGRTWIVRPGRQDGNGDPDLAAMGFVAWYHWADESLPVVPMTPRDPKRERRLRRGSGYVL